VVADSTRDFNYIAEIISIDPSLTLGLLKIVNSAFYGFSVEIDMVSHALGVEGSEQLMQLVCDTMVVSQFKGVDMEYFWKHSVAFGISAHVIHQAREEYDSKLFFWLDS
jgi:HD-like signal output (HDOD) protein